MRTLLLALLLCPLFFGVCHADNLYEQAADMTGVYAAEEALPEEEREISGPLRIDGSYDTHGALQRLWRRVIDALRAQLNEDIRYAGGIVAVAMLCALAAVLAGGKLAGPFVDIAACCAIALMLAGNMESVMGEASGALAQLSDYSKAAMPAVFTAAAASGAVASASARYAAVSLAMDVMISAQQRIVLPLIHAYLAVIISKSLFDNGILQALGQAIRWGITTCLTVITLAFTAYISITGIVAGSTDAVAVKTARTVISSALPVVGGILSDSASVLLSAASVIKNAVGAFSLVAVCALCITPFVKLSVKMLLFKLAAAVSDMLPGARLSRLVGEIGSCFGMLLGMVGCCGIMLFLSIMSGIKVVSP